jgi:predicted ribosomally synthesized peptide with nif11-like leader
MSIENAKNFLNAVKEDNELKQNIKNSIINSIIKIANAEGYSFTEKDYLTVLKELHSEISDDMLDKISGGEADDFIMPKDLLFFNSEYSAFYH